MWHLQAHPTRDAKGKPEPDPEPTLALLKVKRSSPIKKGSRKAGAVALGLSPIVQVPPLLSNVGRGI